MTRSVPFRSTGRSKHPRSVPVGSERVHNYIRVYEHFYPLRGIFKDIPSGRERSERRAGRAHFTQYEARAQRAPDGRAHFKSMRDASAASAETVRPILHSTSRYLGVYTHKICLPPRQILGVYAHPRSPKAIFRGIRAPPETRSVPFRSKGFQNVPVPFRSVPPGAQNTPVPFRSVPNWNGTERNGLERNGCDP